MNTNRKRILAAAVAAVCLIVCTAAAYTMGYSRGYDNRPVSIVEDKTQAVLVDSEETSEDDIKPLEEDTISVLCCGVDNTQKLTDVIMYAVFDTQKNEVNILRIPRDTFVGSAFPTGKMNAIYGHPEDGMSGIETLREYLAENWKLDIDYYVTIDLNGVRDIVDDLGGVTMNIEQQINYLPGKVLYPGEQTLDGEKAEWILRYRSGYRNGDLGRIDAQTEFVKAAIRRVKELGRMKCIPIVMKHYDDVDTDMPLDKMLSTATSLFALDVDDLQMHVVPGTGAMYYSYSVYNADEDALVEILNENFTTQGNGVTAAELNVPSVYGNRSTNKSSSSNQSSSNSSSNSNWSSSSTGSGTNKNTNQSSQSTQKNTDSNSSSNKNELTPQYQYDSDGNPLYRLDKNGDPIYDYDEDGNIVYVYQQVEESSSTKKSSSSSSTTTKSSDKEETEDETPAKSTKKDDDKKVILSKSNQEKAAEEKAEQEALEKEEEEQSNKVKVKPSSSKTGSSSKSSSKSSSANKE